MDPLPLHAKSYFPYISVSFCVCLSGLGAAFFLFFNWRYFRQTPYPLHSLLTYSFYPFTHEKSDLSFVCKETAKYVCHSGRRNVYFLNLCSCIQTLCSLFQISRKSCGLLWVICATMGTDGNHPLNVTVKAECKINELQPVLSAPSHKTVFHRLSFMNPSG